MPLSKDAARLDASGRSGSRYAICMRRGSEAIVELSRGALVGQLGTFDMSL